MAAKEQAVLEISVTGVDKAASQFSSFQQTTTKTMSSSEAAVTRSLKNMVSQFVGVAAAARAVQTVISSGVGFNQFVENTTTSFTVMMKSAEKAKAQMKDLYDFAVNSPLTFKETAASSKQLMAYGFAAEELIPTMRTLGSVAIATGHSLDDISYVYGTLKSQGRAYSRDLMQFGMRGIPIYEELAKVMGADVKQIQKMASEGKIGFAEVEKAFENMTTGSGRFSGVIEGYMTTLTGKLSMLGDIAQQSAGSLMGGVTDSLKTFVDQMTASLSSGSMGSFVKDMSDMLGTVSSLLFGIITALATILPIIGKIMKALVPAAAVLLFFKTLTMIPAILMAVGAAATTVATAMTAAAASMTVGAAASSALAIGASTAATGIGALSASLKALAVANPWLLALVAIAAAGGAVITILSGVAAEARASPNENVRMKQLEKDFAQVDVQGPGAGSTKPAWLKASDVQRLAEEYKLAEGTTANILINSGALSRDVWQQYLNTKSVNMALQEQDKIAKGLKHTSLTIEQEQAKYFAGITGYSMERYYDPDDTTAFGRRAANDYIAAVQATTQQQKDLLGSAFMPEDSKKLLEDELKSVTDKLQATLSSGLGMADLEKSGYLQGLRDYIEKLQAQLDGFGKKAKKLKDNDLGTWWAPLVQAAKLTLDPLDDIDIAMQQAQESAKKEFDSRQAQYDLLTSQTKDEQLILKYQQDKTAEAALFAQYQQDITKEYEKQKNLATYNQIVSGNDSYWSNMQAEAGKQYGQKGNLVGAALEGIKGIPSAVMSTIKSIPDALKNIPGNIWSGIKGFNALPFGAAITQGKAQLLQGSEVGTAMSNGAGIGVDVLSGLATAAAKFLLSIENVNKVLNPFATMFESTKEILEPLLNNALKPLVQILEQVGYVLGQILAPFTGVLKMISVIVYTALLPLMTVLQLVGSAFEWLYNIVIVPVGNAFIGLVNAIIGAINGALGWLGVNIQYIDALETTTEAMKDFAKIIDNMKNSLDQTIDYLTDKINDAVDKQLASLQDLYEVGAITATDYEKQAKGLDAQKIKTDDVLVSAMDKAITSTAEMYNRLGELYNLKDVLTNTEGLTEEQQVKLLKDAGLSDINLETAMTNAVYAALDSYGAAKTDAAAQDEANKLAYQNKIDASQKAVDEAKDQMQRYSIAIFNDQRALKLSSGLNFGAWSDKASHEAELQKWQAAYAKAVAELETLKSSGSFAVGTSYVPQDMTANIHKGEGIVPATFMDSIRSGELTLSGGGNEGSGQNVNVYVTVQGSVTSEDDLATVVAQNIYKQRKSGALTI